jgi:hypothetical protein
MSVIRPLEPYEHDIHYIIQKYGFDDRRVYQQIDKTLTFEQNLSQCLL